MEKQSQIFAAALKLFVEQGFHGTPTSQIAKVAGVSNGTLFHYYSTKEDLVVALYNHIKEELGAYLEGQVNQVQATQDKIKTVFISSLHWALEHPQEFYYVQQFHFSPHMTKVPAEVLGQQSRLHTDLIQEAIDNQLVRPLPVPFLFTLVSSHVYGLYQYLVSTPVSAETHSQLLEEGFRMLWQMLRT